MNYLASTKRTLPGLLFTGSIALLAACCARQLGFAQVSPVTISLLIGLVAGNVFRIPVKFEAGMNFAMGGLLRISIVFLGFRLTLQDLVRIGPAALVVDTLVVVSTFLFAIWLTRKVFGLNAQLGYLIASGSAICGASAILATAPIVKSENHDNAVAIGVVTVFGSIAMMVYPILYGAGYFIGFDQKMFGVFAGASIHEMAQVVSAGFAVSTQAGDTAVLVKMVRVLMLAPVLVVLSFLLNRGHRTANVRRLTFPWFVPGFLAAATISSMSILPGHAIVLPSRIGEALLLLGMAAIGLKTSLRRIRHIGLKPLYAASLISLFLFAIAFIATSLTRLR